MPRPCASLRDTAAARRDGLLLEQRFPHLSHGPFLLGSIDASAGRDTSAERWLALALQRDPGDTEALRLYPMVLFRLGRATAAAAEFGRYFTLTHAESWDWAMLYYWALCLESLGQDREALVAFDRATQIRPQLAEAWIEFAYTLAATRDSTIRDTAHARSALAQGLRYADLKDVALRARVAAVRAAIGQKR